jgi:2-polyprenyl-3-methyl-5-hydroxy-6-metoxy-1,4-benzoquinol methylase
MTDNTDNTFYDEPQVVISRMIGRRYNNPLGEEAFPLIATLLPQEPLVLDVGCGRGASSRWWAAHARARVTALDLSSAMLEEARREALVTELDGQITFMLASLQELPREHSFDLILFHDVLCYDPNKQTTLERAFTLVKPGGIVSLTDYHSSDISPDPVANVIQSWNLVPPPHYELYRTWLRAAGFKLLSFINTTGQYRSHWREVERRLQEHESALLQAVGPEEFDKYAAKIRTIHEAILSGNFGHLWAVLQHPA